MLEVTLAYSGNAADRNTVDLYDAAQALVGFQRSLALTTHLILNGEIITQAPALRGARILTTAPEEGSWKVTAAVVAGLFTAGTASKETPLGHLIYSAYDYVIKETMGFHVDFNQSLGQQYEKELKAKNITSEKMDSLIEKTEKAVSDIHRPIIGQTHTATKGLLTASVNYNPPVQVGAEFNGATYAYIAHTVKSKDEHTIDGVISSYNTNTFKGRIYCFDEQRPIPFELAQTARRRKDVNAITSSLRANALDRKNSKAVSLKCFRLESSTGRLKALIVNSVGQYVDEDDDI